MIINERTVKYLAIYVSTTSRTSKRIRVTDIESLNAITAMRKMQKDFGLEECNLRLVPEDGGAFDDNEILTLYVYDGFHEGGDFIGEVYLIDARALPKKLYVETSVNGLITMGSELNSYADAEYFERYAAISITNENPVFRITGVI